MNAPPSRQIAQTVPVPSGKAKGRTWLFGVGALILLLGAFWYLTRADNAPAGGRPHAAAAAPVRVAQVVRRDMAVIRRTPGTVIANTTVQITARVQGIIESANFKEGQFVKKGDLLFQIDPRPFQAALEQAQAQVARDRAQLASAQADADRAVMLTQRGIVSEQQRDQLVAAAKALQASIAADQAAINIAQLNLEYSRIRSPVDGKTGPILVQPGNLVQANSAAPLVTVAEIQPIKISFSLPQSDLQLILERQKTNGLTAMVDSTDAEGKPLSAPVDFTSNAVNNQSGTIELRATFDNKEFSFLPGQLVNVTVELNTIPNALVIPRDALNDGPNGSYVYVVAGGKALQRDVKVVFDDSKNVAIEGDVKPGDQVIVEGQLRVEANTAVNVLRPSGGSRDQGSGTGNGAAPQ